MNTLSKRFKSDRRGSIPMIFAAALVPILGLTGGAIDYGRSVVDKALLDNAMDGAIILAARAAQASRTTEKPRVSQRSIQIAN